MTEDNFEKFLKKTAQTYNVPPVRVPREEMWTAIQAKRAAGPRVVYGGGAARAASERRFGTRVWLGAAAAAMLLIATGVGIGRWTASTPSVAGNQPIPTQPVTVTGPDERNSVEPPANPQVATTTSPSGTQPTAAANTSVRERRPSDAGARTTTTRVATGGTNHSGSPSTSAYQITAVQNLSEAEALLTSFRSRSGADQQMDAQLGTWARQLLTNTRLLLDSPVGDDPQRRPLLQDLELVLVQIVQQLSPGSTPQDRDLIEKTMRDNHVMTRLRTAIPAGAQRGS